MDAGEVGLRPTVGLIDHPALWARPRRVTGVDGGHGYARELRLVRGELAKLSECPSVKSVALCLSGLNPLADVAEVFHRNRKPGAFGNRNDLLTDTVVHMLPEAGFLAAQDTQPALGGLGASALKTSATTRELGSDAFYIGAGVAVAETVEGEIDDPEINAKHAFNVDLLRVWHVANAREIPFATHEHQIDLALAEGEQSALPLTADIGNLLPAGERPDVHSVVAQEPHDPIVIGLGGVPPKSAHALSFVGPLRGVRVCDLGDAPDGSLGRKTKPRAGFGVGQLVQIILAHFTRSMGAFGQPITRRIATLQRLAKHLPLGARRLQLDVGDEFHSSSIDETAPYGKERHISEPVNPSVQEKG